MPGTKRKAVGGTAPVVSSQRPTAPPVWWTAQGAVDAAGLTVHAVRESDGPRPGEGPCGLAAPCSLPRAFLVHLGLAGDRAAILASLEKRTAARLLKEARAYATRSPRGLKQPLRDPRESRSALARERLSAFRAALPLLRRETARTLPWAGAGHAAPLFEVDVPSFLAALSLPATGLSGDREAAILRRAAVLDGLGRGVGFDVDVTSVRDCAVAARGALDAVMACTAAAWFLRVRPSPPGVEAEAWLPAP